MLRLISQPYCWHKSIKTKLKTFPVKTKNEMTKCNNLHITQKLVTNHISSNKNEIDRG